MTLGNNIPNPFNTNTVIPYYIPRETEQAFINIHDLAGRELRRYPLSSNENLLEISMSEYDKGVYFYSLIVGEITLETKRMIIIK